MSEKWNRWSSRRPDTKPTDILDILYIDDQNRIVNATKPVSDINWLDSRLVILAWRPAPVPKPATPAHLGTVYWNYINGKFWPRTFRRPPKYKLPYFRIEVSMYPDGTPQFDYFLLDPE